MKQILNCIDAGSEYCPCYLAETGECIMCSQLQGKTFCDCKNWKGVCIYQEYVWNRFRMKACRENIVCKIVEKQKVSDTVMILRIKVNKTMGRELSQPGAYVFLKSLKDPSYFDTPMSIMEADEREGIIEIAVQVRGVKTKALLESDGDINLRGPYWNGLLGLKYIKGLRNSSVLLVTRGIGQAPALPVARKLVMSGNRVHVILDKGRCGVNFNEKKFKDLGCTVAEESLLELGNLIIPESTLAYIKHIIQKEKIELVYSGGSDKLHQGIGRLLMSMKAGICFACSNDARFCCGEGICGSCHIRLNDGNRIKTCKTQLSPVEIFGGEV